MATKPHATPESDPLATAALTTRIVDPGGADGATLVRSGGSWAALAIGNSAQELVVRSDGTVKWTDPPVVHVKAWGAKFDGATDDTAALQAAGDNAPAGSVLKCPAGTAVSDQLNFDKRLSFEGAAKYGTVIKAKAGATGPLFNMNGTSFRPGFSMRRITFDMNNAPAIQAVYLHNVRNGTIEDVRVDHGTIGIQLDLAQAMNVVGCETYDCSTAGFLSSHATSSGNNYRDCFSWNGNVTGVAGFDITGGIDWWFTNCRAFRAPGSNVDLRYGWRADYANTNATIALLRCSTDGISDRTSDSANVAGVLFRGVGNSIISNSHISGFSLADGTHNKAIVLDGTNSIRIQQNWLSGHGIEFKGTASDSTKVTDNHFYSGDTNGAWFTTTTAPTNLDARGNTYGQGSFNFPIASSPATFYGALTRLAQHAAGLNLDRPAGALFETMDVNRAATNSTALTSGTLYLWAIWLPKGLKVSNISWMSGSTALANGASPHYWVGLFSSTKALLAASADDTAPAIPANAIKTTALSSPYTTTVEGMHYIGVMVNSGGGTQPTISNMAALSAVENLGGVRSATADTGLTTTPPNPAGATSNIGNKIYAYVS